MTKSGQKSARRTHAVLLPNHRGVHELVAGSSAWRVRAARGKAKIGGFAAPHGFSHTTRANISHEEAEQIRARIVRTPAYKGAAGVELICALTGRRAYFLFFLLAILGLCA